jgi:hypothetical protein
MAADPSRRGAALALVLLACYGCAGTGPVASPFTRGKTDFDRIPADAVRQAAAEIERQVYDGNRGPVLTDLDALVIDTPEIRQAVRTRAARVELVNAMLDAGHAWERRNGRLWIIRSDDYKAATTSRKRDLDAIMVNSENRDRWTLYEGILDANSLPQAGLSAVQEIFFDARRELMKSGQKYEGDPDEPVAVP